MYIKDFSWRRRHHLPGPDESRPMEANVRAAGHPQKARAASCSCLPHGLAKQDPVVFLSRQLCWPQRGDCNEMSECQLRADVCLSFKSSECPTEQVPSYHGGTLLPLRDDDSPLWTPPRNEYSWKATVGQGGGGGIHRGGTLLWWSPRCCVSGTAGTFRVGAGPAWVGESRCREGAHLASCFSCSSGMIDSHAMRHWNGNTHTARQRGDADFRVGCELPSHSQPCWATFV